VKARIEALPDPQEKAAIDEALQTEEAAEAQAAAR
jgi:hypothetical protein